jgi:hypothetical protein
MDVPFTDRRMEWRALSKSHNAELAYWGGSPPASQEGAIRGVMPLAKGWTIPREACLAPQGHFLRGAASPFLTR